ncbi:MAG TPA: NAD(P)/FAD-dependent oxidoreductase [Dehalococcoidia bacterium]|nr:NAD(P)/FAD-dependent oxidoreductase [Dehalococcoidia bacterium]
MTDVDVAIIGAGVVGLALAAELAQGRRQVAVIERHGGYGLETSSHNSGVVHAGIYYPTGSLKHTLCLEGNGLLYAWAAAHGVRARRIGKLIIAVDETEADALDGVWRQAAANGVPEMRRIASGDELRELEPRVRCVAALWSGSTGVVDQLALMASFAAAAQERGAWIALKHDLTGVERAGSGFILRMRGPDGADASITAGFLINSAGLGAPAVAAMLGYPLDGGDGVPRLRQRVNKGRYYDIVTPEKARALRHLVYPVPEHGKGGLGVHVTVDLDGGAHLGPDTEWLDDGAPLDYRAADDRRAAFHAAASRYLPSLQPDDLAPGQVGYRPKLQDPGGPIADFLIWRDGGYVHLGGIESPGLTASMAIARHVAATL